MNEVGIFGKKGSIAKYDLSENKPIWVGIIEAGYAPYSICQYKNFVLVFVYKNNTFMSIIQINFTFRHFIETNSK